MNKKIFFSFYPRKSYLSHNDKVQQHFWYKYYFQRAPNQVEKVRKSKGVVGYNKNSLEWKFQGEGGGD